ncbi:sigma-70 family RNA polymerase sigma factor [Danxiaibacter flavus]|uniref:Sigma-70 family RNA polymerase sigma factor n=1 Tax=Danxiaibacter flavus TaxID=3049108 RepID=A0ABV3ZMJ4_9BACT|nr:sigma-70 family RNA polymerase sigma factor [Chitinophagaceae bacterium DXS]
MKLDQEICCWEKIKQGDQRSFTELFDGYWEDLFQYAYRTLKNREDAQEVVQELFVYLWNKRENLPEVQAVSAYLFVALKNRLLNHFAKKKMSLTVINEAEQIAAANSAADILHTKDAEKVLRSKVAQLPEKMQQVYSMYHFEELNIDEIANYTGNSPQTIRNQLNVASKKMKASLSKADDIIIWAGIIFTLFKKN